MSQRANKEFYQRYSISITDPWFLKWFSEEDRTGPKNFHAKIRRAPKVTDNIGASDFRQNILPPIIEKEVHKADH